MLRFRTDIIQSVQTWRSRDLRPSCAASTPTWERERVSALQLPRLARLKLQLQRNHGEHVDGSVSLVQPVCEDRKTDPNRKTRRRDVQGKKWCVSVQLEEKISVKICVLPAWSDFCVFVLLGSNTLARVAFSFSRKIARGSSANFPVSVCEFHSLSKSLP